MLDTQVIQDTYEVRYGWTRKNVFLMFVCLLFCLVVFIPFGNERFRLDFIPIPIIAVKVLSVLLGLSGLISVGAGGFSKKALLRVDANGVTLGGHPLRYASSTAMVPWNDVIGVELWVQRLEINGRTNRVSYVGLHRAAGAPALPGAAKNRVSRRMAAGAAGVPAELVAASRAVNVWKIDPNAFYATVKLHRPALEIRVDPEFQGKKP